MSVVKEYNLCLHFDTKHRDKYAKFSLQVKQQIVQELKGGLHRSRICLQKVQLKTMFLHRKQHCSYNWPFEGNHNADVALGENEFVTRSEEHTSELQSR